MIKESLFPILACPFKEVIENVIFSLQPIKCQDCNNLFQSYEVLKHHQSVPFVCSNCNKKFGSSCKLFSHDCDPRPPTETPSRSLLVPNILKKRASSNNVANSKDLGNNVANKKTSDDNAVENRRKSFTNGDDDDVDDSDGDFVPKSLNSGKKQQRSSSTDSSSNGLKPICPRLELCEVMNSSPSPFGEVQQQIASLRNYLLKKINVRSDSIQRLEGYLKYFVLDARKRFLGLGPLRTFEKFQAKFGKDENSYLRQNFCLPEELLADAAPVTKEPEPKQTSSSSSPKPGASVTPVRTSTRRKIKTLKARSPPPPSDDDDDGDGPAFDGDEDDGVRKKRKSSK